MWKALAYDEHGNILGTRKRKRETYSVLEVDKDVARFWGQPLRTLSNYGIRKWENMVYLDAEKEHLIFSYN